MRRWVSAVVALLLLGAAAAHARPVVVRADFDGDGHNDYATIGARHPTMLRVWLSTIETEAIVQSPEPLVRLTAADLDGDRRAELVGVHARAGVQIWSLDRGALRVVTPTVRAHALAPLQRIALAPAGAPAVPSLGPTLLRIDGVTPSRGDTVEVAVPSRCLYAPMLVRGPTGPPLPAALAPRPPPAA